MGVSNNKMIRLVTVGIRGDSTVVRPGIEVTSIVEHEFKATFMDVSTQRWLGSTLEQSTPSVRYKFRVARTGALTAPTTDIVYVIVDDVKWTVMSVVDQYPRLILTLGKEYHG